MKKERDKLRELSKAAIKNGKLINKDVPANATSSDKFKYEVFQKILSMVISGKIGKDELIVRLGINKDRLDKMLHCYVGEFTADEVFSFIDKLGMSSISTKNKSNDKYFKKVNSREILVNHLLAPGTSKADKIKFSICQEICKIKLENKLEYSDIAKLTGLEIIQIKQITHSHYESFTLDVLVHALDSIKKRLNEG